MDTITLSIFTIANLLFLTLGFRMGRGASPIPSAKPIWTNLKKFAGAEKPPEQPEKKAAPKPPLQITRF